MWLSYGKAMPIKCKFIKLLCSFYYQCAPFSASQHMYMYVKYVINLKMNFTFFLIALCILNYEGNALTLISWSDLQCTCNQRNNGPVSLT